MNFYVKDSEGNILLRLSTVIALISLLMAISCILTASSSQEVFVAQISFASTITSLILSVLAIWMSVTGERKTNDIKSQITDSSDRLSKTASKVEQLNETYETAISSQIEELKNVQKNLSILLARSASAQESEIKRLTDSREIVTQGVFDISASDDDLSSTNRITMFKNVYQWALSGTHDSMYHTIFCSMVEQFIASHKNEKNLDYNDCLDQLSKSVIDINSWNRVIDTNWGIINSLAASSVFTDEKAVEKILHIIKKN